MLHIAGISKAYRRDGAPDVTALRELTLKVPEGQFLSVIGPNGCGKSTLLKVLSGEIAPDKGRAEISAGDGDFNLLRLTDQLRARVVARVEQDPRLGSVPDLSVWENLWLATHVSIQRIVLGFGSADKVLRSRNELLQGLGFEGKVNSKINELSGGQRQVIAVLLAVLRSPRLLLLDEHTASLDRRNADLCLSLATKLSKEEGKSVISVTHNLVEALEFGDRLIVMGDGQVVADFSRTEMNKLTTTDLVALMRMRSQIYDGMDEVPRPRN